MPLNDGCYACQPTAGTPPGFSGPDAPLHYPPDLDLEPTHLDIRLTLDMVQETAQGVVTTSVTARQSGPRSLKLNAVDFEELQVTDSDARPLRFFYDGEILEVHWLEPFTQGETRKAVVSYRVAHPVSGLFFSKPSTQYPDEPWFAATDHETERARHWLPCVDSPAARTMLDLHLRAESRFTILANGALQDEVEHGDGTKTAHWRLTTPCPSYLVCFAMGEFICFDDGQLDGIPLAYFATPRFSPPDLARTFGRTRDMLAWMTGRLALPYPFPKYYQVALPHLGGAMENISLVTWNDVFVLDEKLAQEWGWLVDQVNVHEMAHSYFGDLVVIRDFAHAWLKESWATYMEQCWLEHRFGQDEALYDFYRNAQAYFTEADQRYRRPIVTRQFLSSWQMYDRHLYPGGACRLHMLRRLLGEEVFWGAVHDYLARYAGQAVETDDFRRTLEERSGRALGKFFDQWLFTAGYPAIKVTFAYDETRRRGTFEVEQTQVDKDKGIPAFELHTDLGWVIDGVLHSQPVRLSEAKHAFAFPMAGGPEQVRFDPFCKVLAKLEFNPGDPMLRRQLVAAQDVIGRIEAVHTLAKTGRRSNLHYVLGAYKGEPFWGVREQMAKALGEAGSEAAVKALVEIIGLEQDPKVMEAVFRAAGRYRDARVLEAVRLRLHPHLPYRALAAAFEALGAQRQEAPWESLLDGACREDWGGFAQAGALRGLAATRRRDALEWLTQNVDYGRLPRRARPAAVTALADIGAVQERSAREPVVEKVLDLLRDPDPRVHKAASSGLKTLEARDAISALEQYRRSLPHQDRVAVDQIVKEMRSAEQPRQASFEKQLEELREKHRKLEERVRKLEDDEAISQR